MERSVVRRRRAAPRLIIHARGLISKGPYTIAKPANARTHAVAEAWSMGSRAMPKAAIMRVSGGDDRGAVDELDRTCRSERTTGMAETRARHHCECHEGDGTGSPAMQSTGGRNDIGPADAEGQQEKPEWHKREGNVEDENERLGACTFAGPTSEF